MEPSRKSEETTSVVPERLSDPRADRGLQTSASSKRDDGGNANPSSWGSSPQALHTADISMPDLVPSMKLLCIFGFMPRDTASSEKSKFFHTVSGVD